MRSPWPQNPTDRFQYTYDRDSNRLARNNLLRPLHDFDEVYTYDNFNQLTNFTRNTHSEGWGLDNLGNWKTFSNDQTGPPSHTRGHNIQNQITTIDVRLDHADLRRQRQHHQRRARQVVQL
jgi:hypothetical protein